jgi:putative membrane protein
MTPLELKKLSKIDAVYGVSDIILLAAGLTLWLGGVGKPTAFYSHNWVFHLKITLFVIVGLHSIYPTVFFIKGSKKSDAMVTVPPTVFWMIRIELLIIFTLPLLAGLMSRGVGLYLK